MIKLTCSKSINLIHAIDSTLKVVDSAAIVCSRSVGHGLRAEVYVMMECSYFVCIYFAVDGMPIEMYGESWIAGLLTSDDVMLYMAGFETTRGI